MVANEKAWDEAMNNVQLTSTIAIQLKPTKVKFLCLLVGEGGGKNIQHPLSQ